MGEDNLIGLRHHQKVEQLCRTLICDSFNVPEYMIISCLMVIINIFY